MRDLSCSWQTVYLVGRWGDDVGWNVSSRDVRSLEAAPLASVLHRVHERCELGLWRRRHRAAAGEAEAWRIEYSLPWPAWATLLFVVAAVFSIVALYLHEGGRASRGHRLGLSVLRVLLLGMLLMMIAGLSLSIQRMGLPYVAVLVDDSLSMATVDQYGTKANRTMVERVEQAGIEGGQTSRWNLLRTLLTERESALARGILKDYKLRVYRLTGNRRSDVNDVAIFAEELRSASASGDRTRLGAGVQAVLDDFRGTTPAAIVLMSDGINTDGPPLEEAVENARRRGVPLFAVGLGSDQPSRDLKLSDVSVEDVAFVDDLLTFQCMVAAVGYRGAKVAVVLREKGRPDVLAKADATIDGDGDARQVQISFRPTRVGRHEFVVEVEPQTNKAQVDNNRQTRIVEVRDDKLRVLLVQGYPTFEYRYLRNMLQRDETIQLHTFLQEADAEYAAQDAGRCACFRCVVKSSSRTMR